MSDQSMDWTRRALLQGAGGTLLASSLPRSLKANRETQSVNALLEPIRSEHDLPALAVVVLKRGKIVGQGAVGGRKYGDATPVTLQDKFHLGSCTKAMTAHLCAVLIEKKKLNRNATLAKALPDIPMHPSYRNLTLDHLLSHQSGFPNESWLKGHDFQETRRFPGSPQEQRDAYIRALLKEAPDAPPESKFIYSNRNFTVAGVLAERAMGLAWEELMSKYLFRPLHITSAGFGSMGTPNKLDQPWQHFMAGTARTPIPPGPNSDNPSPLAPAGTVHMSLPDWAKFVQDHVYGLRDEEAQLTAESYKYLHTPLFGGEYMGGWIATNRGWGGGRVFTHAGSNTQNFAVVWMAPLKGFAVLVATNQGGDSAAKACDKAAATMIQTFL